MAKRPTLKAEKRNVLGKQVKKLRKEGVFPSNIYGKDIKSLAVQVPFKDFEAVYKETGETGLVDLQVDAETLPVLIHNVQKDHITKIPLHADFYQVNLKEKVKTMVPVITIGEPKAVTDKLGILMQTLNEVEVEALPADLPEKIEVNIEPLANVGDQMAVSDLKVGSGVAVLTDPAQVVVKIAELVTKEAEKEAAAEAAAKEAAKAESAEGAEEAPAEEEVKSEEKPIEVEKIKEQPKEAPKEQSK